MINSTNMNSINPSVSNMVDTCYAKYGYGTFVCNSNGARVIDVFGAVCWILLFALMYNVLRTCMDPFSVKLHTKIAELETKLSEEEDMYEELYGEKCHLEETNEELKNKLTALATKFENVMTTVLDTALNKKAIDDLTQKHKDTEKTLADIRSQYLCCRDAAQAFIDGVAERRD